MSSLVLLKVCSSEGEWRGGGQPLVPMVQALLDPGCGETYYLNHAVTADGKDTADPSHAGYEPQGGSAKGAGHTVSAEENRVSLSPCHPWVPHSSLISCQHAGLLWASKPTSLLSQPGLTCSG
jgi:hypothetical protein